MKRGDIITIALSGDYGKPRPGLIVQSDLFSETGSVTILPLTSHLIDAPIIRILVDPTVSNGLIKASHIMVDKLYTTPREKVGGILGHLDAKIMLEVERALAVFIGIA
jgi:mRNA interferase MazF